MEMIHQRLRRLRLALISAHSPPLCVCSRQAAFRRGRHWRL